MKTLETELRKYEEILPTLKNEEGKYIVIYQTQVIGIFNDYEDALRGGYEVAALEPFLVKKILTIENIYHFTRDMRLTCHTAVSH